MNKQDEELYQNISHNLRTLIRGLTQNNITETYEAYKALIQIGVQAIPQVRDAVLKSNWSKIKYPNEIRYLSGLVNLIYDINEAEARKITDQLKRNGCDLVVARVLNSICRYTLADYKQYNVCGVKILEHKKLLPKQNVKVKIERWLKNVPSKDLQEIERIYILRMEDLESSGSYKPILYQINLVWDNPFSKWNPISWVFNLIIENTLYHEIGHHVGKHIFGQIPEQEKEAGKYAHRIMWNSNRLLFSILRFIRRIV